MKKIDCLYDMYSLRAGMCKNPPILAVDNNRYSLDFRGDLLDYLQEIEGKTESEEKFKSMQVEPIKSAGRGEKIDRIMGHSLLFERGKVYFNRVSSDEGKPYMDKLIQQITDYNVMDSNDLMDSLEMALLKGRNYINSELTVAG